MDKKLCRYCAFCRSPLQVFPRKSLGVKNTFVSAICALTLIFVFKRWADPFFLVVWVGFIMIAEIFIQIRWRLSVMCQNCGFDPVLYLKNKEEAAKKVKTQLGFRDSKRTSQFVRTLPIPSLSFNRAKELGFLENQLSKNLQKQDKSIDHDI